MSWFGPPANLAPIAVAHTVPRTHRSHAITWQPVRDGPIENISQWQAVDQENRLQTLAAEAGKI